MGIALESEFRPKTAFNSKIIWFSASVSEINLTWIYLFMFFNNYQFQGPKTLDPLKWTENKHSLDALSTVPEDCCPSWSGSLELSVLKSAASKLDSDSYLLGMQEVKRELKRVWASRTLLLVPEEGCNHWLWHSLKIFSLFSFSWL